MPDGPNTTQAELIRLIQEQIVTNRESVKATRELRGAVDALRSEIASTYVRKDVYLEARKADAEAGLVLQDRVNRVSSVIDWTGKIIVGAVLLALLGLVLVSNGGPP